MLRIAVGVYVEDWLVTTPMINAGSVSVHRGEFLEDDSTLVAISSEPLFSVPLIRAENSPALSCSSLSHHG